MTKCKECNRGVWARGLCGSHYAADWKRRNPERAAEHTRKMHAKQHASGDARRRTQTWRERNRDRDRANAARRRSEKPAECRAAIKRWEQANPDACLRYRTNRRARLAGGSFSREEWRELCGLYEGTCPRCRRAVKRFTVDHIIPLVLGGSNYIWNVQPLCKSCNSSKRTSLEPWYPPPCFSR